MTRVTKGRDADHVSIQPRTCYRVSLMSCWGPPEWMGIVPTEKDNHLFRGDIVSIYVAASAGAPMESLEHVQAIAGRGLEGDRYFRGTGYWSKNIAVSREITLIEIESIEALAREKYIEIGPGAARRNIVTRGVPLNHLVGCELQDGSVRLRGTRLCEPCQYLESLTTKGLFAGLVHRGGLRAVILYSGTVRVGDQITPGAEPAQP